MRLRSALPLLLAGSLMLAACRRTPPPTALQRMDAQAATVFHGASLGQAGSALGALLARLDSRGRTPDAPSTRDEVARRLGFDPFGAEGLQVAGFAPGGTWAAAYHGNGSWLWVLPADKPEVALATAERLAVQASGATRRREDAQAGTPLVLLGKPFGSREVPVLAAAAHGGQVLLGTGRDGEALVRAALDRKPESSLAPRIAAGDEGAPIRFILDAARSAQGTAADRLAGGLVKSAQGTLVPSAAGLVLRSHVDLVDDRAQQALASLFPAGGALPLGSFAAADAVVLGQGALAWQGARGVADSVDPTGTRAAQQLAARAGLDVDEGFLQLTDGHVAGAMALLGPTQLAALLRTGVDIRRQLLRLLPFTVAFRPATGRSPADLVTRLEESFTQRGLVVEAVEGDPQVKQARSPAQDWLRYRFGAVGGVLLVAAGDPERAARAFADARAATAPNGTSGDPLARGDAQVLVVRSEHAARYLDALGREDLGQGAEALMLRNALVRLRGVAGQVGTLQLVVSRAGQGVDVALDLPLLGAGG